MPQKVSVKVEGLDNLKRTMRAAGVEMGELNKVTSEVAGIVAPVAAGMAPRGQTGRLAGGVKGRGLRTRARITDNVVYAGVQHYGWPARHIVGRTFAVNAAQATEPRWTEVIRQGIQRIVDKVRGV